MLRKAWTWLRTQESGDPLKAPSSLSDLFRAITGLHLLKSLYSCNVVTMRLLEPAFSMGK